MLLLRDSAALGVRIAWHAAERWQNVLVINFGVNFDRLPNRVPSAPRLTDSINVNLPGPYLMADREGFEPSNGFHRYSLSRRAPSTTRPPVRTGKGEIHAPARRRKPSENMSSPGQKRTPPEFSPGPSLTLRAFAARNGSLNHFVRLRRTAA